jgi:hypothetical protein
MRTRLPAIFVHLLCALAIVVVARSAYADEPADEHHDAEAPTEHHEAEAADERAEHHEAAAAATAPVDEDVDDDADDAGDADGSAAPDLDNDPEYRADFAGVSPTIDTDAVDKELADRPAAKDLLPSISIEQFQKAVRAAKRLVLGRMEAKMEKSSAKKLRQFSTGVFVFSLLGLLLLATPLVVGKKYPGKGGVLFKYSAFAAVTFFVTVNLFGAVLMGMRVAQGALGSATNPSLAIASGTFDTLDRNAEAYVSMGKELFMPTLEQLHGGGEQPSVVLLENGQKIVRDATVFVKVAKLLKKIDFIFKILPIILFGVTMILFGLAIRPTLVEIVRLPMRAASGEAGAGRDVTKRAMRRVWGELVATLCTIGVLVALTLVSGFVLGRIVGPALDSLLDYFSRSVLYLQFVPDASSTRVFISLVGVILFLGLNVVAIIVSMSFFLGKCQKIFQARFNDGTPVGSHARFFRGGIPSVLLVQALPWVFAVVMDVVLRKLDESAFAGVTAAADVAWGRVLLLGPAILVLGFLAWFWAARGMKAIRFLQSYKVVPVVPPAPQFEPAAVSDDDRTTAWNR